MDAQIRVRREGSRDLPVLVFRLPALMRAVASAPHGGGIGVRRWVVNAQVPHSYGRRDPDHHLTKLAVSLGLPGRGVGMLTAAEVRDLRRGADSGVEVMATVGLHHPILAAAADESRVAQLVAGTINIVAVIPERLSDGALVNAVATVTEAKTQALLDAGLRATGWGGRLARATHADAPPSSGPGRRLKVMAEPDVGAFGITTAAVVLILGWTALAAIAPDARLLAALWCPSRTLMVGTTLAVPYARTQGLTSAVLASDGSREATTVAADTGLAVAVGLALWWRPGAGGAAILAAIGGAASVVALARRRLGGFTGDMLGAVGVVSETMGLLGAAARW